LQYHLTILRSDFRGTVLNERAVWWLGGLRNIAVAGGSVELRKYSRTMNRMWAATQRRNRIRKNSATLKVTLTTLTPWFSLPPQS